MNHQMHTQNSMYRFLAQRNQVRAEFFLVMAQVIAVYSFQGKLSDGNFCHNRCLNPVVSDGGRALEHCLLAARDRGVLTGQGPRCDCGCRDSVLAAWLPFVLASFQIWFSSLCWHICSLTNSVSVKSVILSCLYLRIMSDSLILSFIFLEHLLYTRNSSVWDK